MKRRRHQWRYQHSSSVQPEYPFSICRFAPHCSFIVSNVVNLLRCDSLLSLQLSISDFEAVTSLLMKLRGSDDAVDELLKYIDTPPLISMFASTVGGTLEGLIHQRYRRLVVKKGQVEVVKYRKDRKEEVRASDSQRMPKSMSFLTPLQTHRFKHEGGFETAKENKPILVRSSTAGKPIDNWDDHDEAMYHEKLAAQGRAEEIKKMRGSAAPKSLSEALGRSVPSQPDVQSLLAKKTASPTRRVPRGVKCNACMERPKDPMVGECMHVACSKCWQAWGKSTCIVCRQKVVLKRVVFE